MSRSSRKETQRIALSGLLVALMLVLGYIEHLIPVGAAIPGIKLGLSNGVLIFAVYMLGIPHAFMLMLLNPRICASFSAILGRYPGSFRLPR